MNSFSFPTNKYCYYLNSGCKTCIQEPQHLDSYVPLSISKVCFQKKIKEEVDDRDEFDLLADDQKSLTEKLGNSPDMIAKKVKAAKKGKVVR